MKNFPSSLIKQKTTKQGLGNNLGTTLKNIGSKILKNLISGGKGELSLSDLQNNFNNGYEILDLEHELDNTNINKFSNSINETDIDQYMNKMNSGVSLNANIQNGLSNFKDNYVYFEDPFVFSSSIFSVINNYKYILKSTVPDIYEHALPKDKSNPKGDHEMAILHSGVSPSLFNPFNGVDVTGITERVPLILYGNSDLGGQTLDNGLGDNISVFNGGEKPEEATISLQTMLPPGVKDDVDISDCTIKTLVELSKDPKTSELGLATYRYADFMYCKDLGKLSNNHLITLRKFPGPIGDNIFKGAYPDNIDNPEAAYPDIGRLITWFGNEDNKLEDICKFNYNATWKEFQAAIQEVNSQQKDEGILNKIANSFSPQNNQLMAKGYTSNSGLLGWGAAKLNIPILSGDRATQDYYGMELLENYDKNRIYEPQNTIWDTHKYEGRLVFNQEITLTFRYTLRSYANINPKSAFLDLIGNIMAVTYRRGSFWGGQTKINGPQGNNSVYKTAYKWGEEKLEELGGIWNLFTSGQFTMQDLQGWLGNIMDMAKDALGEATNAASGFVKEATGNASQMTGEETSASQNAKDKGKEVLNILKEQNHKYGWTNAIKGMFKNQLGRPAMYAVNSLLSGEAVGPWHLTIGNPRNPIMSMGNMIMTGAEIQQSGPLGIDDFPSELKVTVQLKHGRPRDSVEIEKMYTKGRSAIYKPMNLMQLKQYKNNPNAFGDIFKEDGTMIYGGKEGEAVIEKILRNL